MDPGGRRPEASEDLDERHWRLAFEALPGLDKVEVSVAVGVDHDVVLAPEVGVVRLSRQLDNGAAMRRRRELLVRLNECGLPFLIPRPLSDVLEADGVSALAISWIPGSRHERDHGDPSALAGVMTALRSVDPERLADVLEPAHAYAGGEGWATLMADAVDELPPDVRSEALRRIERAQALESVPASLVHGDLGGPNMFWDSDGRLVGVIDWDWAAASDPAIDAGCLSWHGWDTVRSAVDADTYRRARVWYDTFPLEQLVAARLRPPGHPDMVNRAASWIRRTS